MYCYRDRTFCGSPNCKNKCESQLTKEQAADAESMNMPIAYSEFCDANGEVISHG